MRKVLIIGDSTLSESPFIESYINLFNEQSVDYDIVFWNRSSHPVKNSISNHYYFNQRINNNTNYFNKLWCLLKYRNFVKSITREKGYTHVIIFTIFHAVIFYPFLHRLFKQKFIFDIRDYSPICRFKFIYRILTKLVRESSITVVSSRGFLSWLPKNYNYLISHNVSKAILRHSGHYTVKPIHAPLKILTIGSISYIHSQISMIDRLKNINDYHLFFVGDSVDVPILKNYVLEHGIKNVMFKGRYVKADELEIVQDYDMINIFLEQGTNADTCLANRFYLSMLLRKPMIVNAHSYQGYLVEKYHLGIVVDNLDDIESQIQQYWNTFNPILYERECLKVMSLVEQDIDLFETKILSAVK